MEEIVINLKDKKEYFIEVTKTGENAMICPVCSDTRKKKKLKCFYYNTQKEVGSCRHCSVVLVKKKEFKMAGPKTYKKPDTKGSSYLSKNLVEWFSSRSISQQTLADLKIMEGQTYMTQVKKSINTVQFNYFRDGNLVNTKYRDGNKNFQLAPGAELIMYNLDAVKGQPVVIIVEGEIDAASFHEAGIKFVTSVPNGASIGKNNLQYLDNCIDDFGEDTEFILAVDNDASGKRLRDDLLRRLGVENCYKVDFKDCKDANEYLLKYGKEALVEVVNNKQEFQIAGVFTVSNINDEIDDYYLNGLPEGVGIGIPEFDELIKFHKKYLTTITGIPGHGKSEFLDFVIIRLNVLAGWKFAIYSPENFPLQLHFSKLAEKLIGKPFTGEGRMTREELEMAKKYLNENFFFIKPEEDFSIDNILSLVKSLVRRKGISGFVIDAWNKLEHMYETSETQYVSKQLDKLALFCEANNLHLFMIAHPTKIAKDKTTDQFEVPNLYSISGSANFFNKTSNGITVYKNRRTRLVDLFIQKVKFKHWGKTGSVSLQWDFKTGRYYKDEPEYSNWIPVEVPNIPLPPDLNEDSNIDIQDECPF